MEFHIPSYSDVDPKPTLNFLSPDYAADLKRRRGIDVDQPHRIRFKRI